MKKSPADLNSVRVLLDVVDAGSFSAAARKREVPTNRISRQVQRLEDDLGVRLLQRTTRRLGLTSAGQVFVQDAAPALEQLECVLQETGTQAHEPKGHLRVAGPTNFFSLLSPERLAQFLTRHPAISLELLLSDDQVDLVSAGIDLALRAGASRDENLVARRLSTSRLIVVASPSCIGQYGRPNTTADLATFPCLSLKGKNGYTRWLLKGPEGSVAVQVPVRCTVNGMDALITAAKAGIGAVRVPQRLVRDGLTQGLLVHLIPQYHFDGSGLFAVYPSRRHPKAAVTALLDFFIEESRLAAIST